MVWDRFHGNGLHRVQVRYQLPPLESRPRQSDRVIHLPSAAVAAVGPPGLETELVASAVSPRYGRRDSALAWVLSVERPLPLDLLTVVLRSDHAVSGNTLTVADSDQVKGTAGTVRRTVNLYTANGHRGHRLVLQEEPADEVFVDEGLSGMFTNAWISSLASGRGRRALVHEAEGAKANGRVLELPDASTVALGAKR